MRRSLIVAILVMAVWCLASTCASALGFTHNAYILSGGSAVIVGSGPTEVAFGDGGSFAGMGTWAGYDWDVAGQQTGSTVFYTAETPTIPGFVVEQTGSVGEFAFGAYYEIVDISLVYGVALFTRPGATGWLGTWTQEVHKIDGTSMAGTLEITSADNGILAGQYIDWGGESPSITGTYSPDGTFEIVVPVWSNCTYYGTYGSGWHGYLSSPGNVGYFIDNNMIPEPSALVALLSGIVGIAGLARRRR